MMEIGRIIKEASVKNEIIILLVPSTHEKTLQAIVRNFFEGSLVNNEVEIF